MTAKSTTAKKATKSFEESLWETAPGLANMNVAVRRLSANLGEVPADTFFKDQHPDLKADYIMANPPFNLKDWRAADELVLDGRWNGYDTPPTGNANYAWILHMVSEHGVADLCEKVSDKTTGEPEKTIKAFPDRTEIAAGTYSPYFPN